eukprot:53448-Amphidinium_carterae.1
MQSPSRPCSKQESPRKQPSACAKRLFADPFENFRLLEIEDFHARCFNCIAQLSNSKSIFEMISEPQKARIPLQQTRSY